MPPEAEPVMQARTATVTASFTSGLGMTFSASATTLKPGKAAMTPPTRHSDAVFIDASSDPATAALLPSANLPMTRLNAKKSERLFP
jgi:hypothetical protein